MGTGPGSTIYSEDLEPLARHLRAQALFEPKGVLASFFQGSVGAGQLATEDWRETKLKKGANGPAEQEGAHEFQLGIPELGEA